MSHSTPYLPSCSDAYSVSLLFPQQIKPDSSPLIFPPFFSFVCVVALYLQQLPAAGGPVCLQAGPGLVCAPGTAGHALQS